jgi:uncharacterized protein (TIGR02300 family)
MATATKAARGTKRTCQNTDCGSRFYDLNREPADCPLCGTTWVAPVATPAAIAAAQAAADKLRAKLPIKPDFVTAEDAKTDDLPEGEEALADIEVAEEPGAVEADETFLEEEEDGGTDVSGIVGDGGEEPEEQ